MAGPRPRREGRWRTAGTQAQPKRGQGKEFEAFRILELRRREWTDAALETTPGMGDRAARWYGRQAWAVPSAHVAVTPVTARAPVMREDRPIESEPRLVVLLHGAFLNPELWHGYAEALGDRFRVIAPAYS